jgi:hypothetical protein
MMIHLQQICFETMKVHKFCATNALTPDTYKVNITTQTYLFKINLAQSVGEINVIQKTQAIAQLQVYNDVNSHSCISNSSTIQMPRQNS